MINTTRWCVAAALWLVVGAAMARDAASDEHSIRHVESAICDAYEAGDGNSLERRITEDFTLTDDKGVVQNRNQVVRSVARRDPVYLAYRSHDQQVSLNGDSATVTGITSLQGHTANTTFAGDYSYTEKWVYIDGRWKLAANELKLVRTR